MSALEHQLQLNNSGAWKTLASWLSTDHAGEKFACLAGGYLHAIDHRIKLRITTCDSVPGVLLQLNRDTAGAWLAPEPRVEQA